MAELTVGQLAQQIEPIISELNVLKSNISSSFQDISNSTVKSQGKSSFESQIKNLESQADVYDQQFEQEEAKIQAMGGKTRAQTLQEFVILFFYISLLLLIISITMYNFTVTQNIKETMKVLGMLLFSAVVITGLLIRYA
jgi:hypothetical protein